MRYYLPVGFEYADPPPAPRPAEAATGVNSSGAVPMVGQQGQYEPATGPYVYQPSQDLGKGYSREYPVFPDDYALDPYASYAQVQTQVPAQTSALSPIYEGGAMELSTVSGMQVCVPAAGGLEHAGFPAPLGLLAGRFAAHAVQNAILPSPDAVQVDLHRRFASRSLMFAKSFRDPSIVLVSLSMLKLLKD
ncbi:hypothetical protein EVJ58_g7253 [Rhodofomes roseus]|uniref:Uncharacterized protein n=1 Tax=Rhodofomes roseus TaxID=34475 RepID=A0A4Y9Y646_9APHY|nr:hypothetical protein EVJ58_g7253 [Rhodofomes roseus]